MNGLFARLYFDEDVSARLAESISARGFDLLTTTAAKRLGHPILFNFNLLQVRTGCLQYITVATLNC